jgi:ubiquinone/menaquinone biosynthesis C-methylase UbiE
MTVWEHEAENWARWARTPDFDAYWRYRDAFFDEIVPSPGSRTLDIGCGEGRVSRDLAARGHYVVGVDLSPSLVRYAIEADKRSQYLAANAAALPFPDGAFEAVVAYNTIQNVLELDRAVREAARVLAPGGRLCICMTHPMADAGRFESSEPEAAFVIREPYLEERWLDETVERDGLTMRFLGPAHPLQDYTRALQNTGLLIEVLREPRIERLRDPSDARWERIPMFLFLRALKSS